MVKAEAVQKARCRVKLSLWRSRFYLQLLGAQDFAFKTRPKFMIPLDQGGGGTPLNSKLPFRKTTSAVATLCTFFLLTTFARADAFRGTLVHEETLHVAPSTDAARLSQVDRGHELIIIETSRD